MTDISGNPASISVLLAGGIDLSSKAAAIFGTNRLGSFSTLTGTICESGIVPPASMPIYIALTNGIYNEITVSFTASPPNPVKLTLPATVNILGADGSRPVQTAISLGISDPSQPWSITVGPNNPTSSWLSVSPRSGVGPANITLTASGANLGFGAYRGLLVVQSPNALQATTVPVMFALGAVAATGPFISGVVNAASQLPVASPGMVLNINGEKLANGTAVSTLQPAPDLSSSSEYLPVSSGGVSATVNGYPAPLLYVSAKQITIQIPYEVGSGPAVVGVNNNGQIGGFQFQVAPSAPGIYADANGNAIGASAVTPGGSSTVYFTGAGDITPALRTGLAYLPSVAVSSLAAPRLPVSITVGGVQTLTQFVGQPANVVGVMQANFVVPATVLPGNQPVVVTVNGVDSPPAFIQVNAP